MVMVYVTCEKCGSRQSLEDSTVPPSGKVMKCPSCAHPITVMPPDAAGIIAPAPGSRPGAPPRSPTVAGFGSSLPPKIPGKGKSSLLDGPALTSFDSADGGDKGDKDSGFLGGSSALADVPLPRRTSPLAGVDGPKRKMPSPLEGVTDLPTPKRASNEIVDLPAPKRRMFDDTDLPAPKRPSGDITDLPTPKRASDEIVDLPAPKRGVFDDTDLPAPVGPTPTKGGLDLPAPKGFFDDVPAPKAPARPAAPKPPPTPKATQMGTGGQAPDLPAPKGFFADIPAPKSPAKPAAPKPPATPDLPAPKGFFDDIPAPSSSSSRAAAGGVLDLDDLDLEPSQMAPLPRAPGDTAGGGAEPPPLDLEAGDGGAYDLGPLELDAPDHTTAAAPAAPAVPLELPDGGGDYSDMELPSPSSAPASDDGLVTFSSSPSKSAAPALSLDSSASRGDDAGLDLELAVEPGRPSGTTADDVVARIEPDDDRAIDLQDERAAAKRSAEGEEAEAKPASSKRKRITIAIAAAVVVLGAGGFYGFTRWQDSKQRAEVVKSQLALAHKHMSSDRWGKASTSAAKVLEVEPSHDAALGLAAQARYAQALDRGVGAKELVAKGESYFESIVKAAASGPEVDKAKALRALTEQQPQVAIRTLGGVVKKQRNDGTAQLYLGWAYSAAGERDKAIKAYAAALKRNPKRVPALYGRGMAHLGNGQIKEARADFLKVLELEKDHIGAQVGVAQIIEVDRFNDRENRYLEILQRPDLSKHDPRAVSRAWSLAGDEALRAGRVDEAIARYEKGLELHPDNLGAQVGLGKAALVQERYEEALERLKVALQQQATHVDALIAFAEASYRLGKFDDAYGALENAIKLAESNWRIYLVYGDVLRNDERAAIAEAEGAYRKAIELADKSEIAPTVALSKLLVAQNRGQEALAVLAPVESAAEEDAPLAVTLGVAYLGTGEAAKAEQWFRKALARRPNDIEAQLQLGLSEQAQGRTEEAIATLKAAYEASEGREDVGVRLALIYEAAEMNAAADELYGKLIQHPAVSINVRARAGRFYARTGQTDKAVTLGESILAENDRNAAGHFLRGEGLFLAGDFREAQKEFREAVLIDPAAQYYEGLGRAAEALQLYDDARDAFNKAIGIDGKYVRPRVGLGRIKYRRREYNDALDELKIARDLDPTDPQVHFYIGECLYETDRAREAAKAYSDSLKLDDKDAFVHYRLGRAFYDLDKAGSAAAAFNRATTLAEGSEAKWLPEAYRLLGYSARQTNRALAIKGFRAYLDMVPASSPEAKDVKKLLLRLEAGGK